MVEPRGLREEEILAERLRQEARASRPEFSERLHGRLCCAVRECEVRQILSSPRRMAPRWALATVVATVLVATAAVFWQSIGRHPGSALQDANEPPVAVVDPSADMQRVTDLASQAAENLDILVGSAIEAQRWAHLDHDAQVVIQTLADRLPFDVPTALAFSEAPDQLQ